MANAAAKHGTSGAAILLAWGLRVVDSVVVKSSKPDHLKEAMSSLSLALDEEDMREISSLSDSGMTHYCWEPSAVV